MELILDPRVVRTNCVEMSHLAAGSRMSSRARPWNDGTFAMIAR